MRVGKGQSCSKRRNPWPRLSFALNLLPNTKFTSAVKEYEMVKLKLSSLANQVHASAIDCVELPHDGLSLTTKTPDIAHLDVFVWPQVLTNFKARFKCDVLKLAMLKNDHVADLLFGGKAFDCICVFDPSESSSTR